MERLKAQDRAEGVEEVSLGEAEKAAIAEARRVCAASLAELEILLRDALRKTGDPEARAKLEQEFQTDRRRREEERDRAVEKIRRGR